MINIGMEGKSNFFEERISEYVHSSTLAGTEDSWNFNKNDIF